MIVPGSFFTFRVSKTDLILNEGPWTMGNRALILKQWMPEFRFDKEAMTRVLVWVNLHNLDLHHW